MGLDIGMLACPNGPARPLLGEDPSRQRTCGARTAHPP